jgi:hypothetical protein
VEILLKSTSGATIWPMNIQNETSRPMKSSFNLESSFSFSFHCVNIVFSKILNQSNRF